MDACPRKLKTDVVSKWSIYNRSASVVSISSRLRIRYELRAARAYNQCCHPVSAGTDAHPALLAGIGARVFVSRKFSEDNIFQRVVGGVGGCGRPVCRSHSNHILGFLP